MYRWRTLICPSLAPEGFFDDYDEGEEGWFDNWDYWGGEGEEAPYEEEEGGGWDYWGSGDDDATNEALPPTENWAVVPDEKQQPFEVAHDVDETPGSNIQEDPKVGDQPQQPQQTENSQSPSQQPPSVHPIERSNLTKVHPMRSL